MTSEQLQATRALRWRQNSEPVLTQEDAQSWLQQAGLCLFLPRKAQLPAPAPTFVESTLGESNPTPARAAVENSLALVARLIEKDAIVALNLFGSPTDHPDFLVSADTLSFVYALRGDRDWKHAPGSAGSNRVSPLVLEVWKLLEQSGTLSAAQIQSSLGRELTEAAVVRALHELWGSLRVVPLYQDHGQATLWATLQSRHPKALAAAINMSQVTALSVLASLYFTSAVAASAEEAEVFLSPLASRAKVREVIRGLTATRQISMTSLDRETLLFVEGSLPEFEEPVPATPVAPPAEGRRVPRRAFVPAAERPTSGSSIRPARASNKPAPDWKRPARAAGDSPRPRPQASEARRPFQTDTPPSRRASTPGFAAPGGFAKRERPPARPPWKDKGKPGFAKSPSARDPKARWPRENKSPGAAYPPGTAPPEGSRMDRAAGSGPQRPPQRSRDSSFPGRGEFRPSQARGGARPPARRTEGFQPRPPRPGGERDQRPPRREGGFSKPRGDFKDFKPRKAGAPPSKFGGRAAGPGFSRPKFEGAERPARSRPETGGFQGRADDRERRRSAGPPKTHSGKPWERKAGGREQGSFRAPRDRDARPRGGDRPERAGTGTGSRRPPAAGASGSRPERQFSGSRGPKAFGSRPDRERREKPSGASFAGTGKPSSRSGSSRPARPGGFSKSGGFGKRPSSPAGGAPGRPPFRSSTRSSGRPKGAPKRRPQ